MHTGEEHDGHRLSGANEDTIAFISVSMPRDEDSQTPGPHQEQASSKTYRVPASESTGTLPRDDGLSVEDVRPQSLPEAASLFSMSCAIGSD